MTYLVLQMVGSLVAAAFSFAQRRAGRELSTCVTNAPANDASTVAAPVYANRLSTRRPAASSRTRRRLSRCSRNSPTEKPS